MAYSLKEHLIINGMIVELPTFSPGFVEEYGHHAHFLLNKI